MKQHHIWTITAIAVLTFSMGFIGGMKYQQTQKSRGMMTGQFINGNGRDQGQMRNGLNMRPVTGEVLSIDGTTVIVKTQDGGSRIVVLSTGTTFSKTSDATVSDITVGTRISVIGTENQDKSITAQNVQLNPQFRMGGTPSSEEKRK